MPLHTVDLRELWPLLTSLLEMPESRFHARVAGWKHPVTLEWMRLTDIADILRQTAAGRKKVKPIDRPWPDKTVTRKGGRRRNKRRSLDEVRRLLRGGGESD